MFKYFLVCILWLPILLIVVFLRAIRLFPLNWSLKISEMAIKDFEYSVKGTKMEKILKDVKNSAIKDYEQNSR